MCALENKYSMTSLFDLLALDPIETSYDRIELFAVQILGISCKINNNCNQKLQTKDTNTQ